ncbi:MAG: Lrp/AsnC family transcriptional regulator [Candidatus Helarchaeota archaeon]
MVDEIDLKIISDLQNDGRKSLTAIGQEIIKKKKNHDGVLEVQHGISHVSVKKRLNKLIENELIKITADINAEKFNFQIALITAEVESHKKTQEILKKFSKCPRVIFLSTLGGGSYNIACMIACEDRETLNSVLAVCSLRNQKGIRRSEVSICDIPIIPKFIPFKIGNNLHDMEMGHGEFECDKCEKYIEGKCIGCPASEFYKNEAK